MAAHFGGAHAKGFEGVGLARRPSGYRACNGRYGAVQQGNALGALDRPADAIAVYDEVVSRFGDAPEPTLRQQVADALSNKGITLEGLDVS